MSLTMSFFLVFQFCIAAENEPTHTISTRLGFLFCIVLIMLAQFVKNFCLPIAQSNIGSIVPLCIVVLVKCKKIDGSVQLLCGCISNIWCMVV